MLFIDFIFPPHSFRRSLPRYSIHHPPNDFLSALELTKYNSLWELVIPIPFEIRRIIRMGIYIIRFAIFPFHSLSSSSMRILSSNDQVFESTATSSRFLSVCPLCSEMWRKRRLWGIPPRRIGITRVWNPWKLRINKRMIEGTLTVSQSVSWGIPSPSIDKTIWTPEWLMCGEVD